MARRSFADLSTSRGSSPRVAGLPSRPSELAEHAAFAIGDATATPARRQIEGPNGRIVVEPRVMQVLVMLAGAEGRVVSREQLNAVCWNGQAVGDDALNRAIGEARRALANAGSGVKIETIPKIGYRLPPPQQSRDDAGPARVNKARRLVLGGATALLAAVATGTWLGRRTPPRDPRATALLERARQALRDQYPDADRQGLRFLDQAIALAPEDPECWGLKALAERNVAEYAPVDQIDAATARCQQSARRALSLQPHQAEAEAALATLAPIYGDWAAAERRLRDVLDRHPDQTAALGAMGVLMISVGRIRAGSFYNGRAAQLEPLSPIFQYRRAYHQWFLGDLAAADRTIDRAMQLWPRHPAIWYARMHLFGLTGRTAGALSMLRSPAAASMMGPGAALWETTMTALQDGSPAERQAAIRANLGASRASAGGAVNAILLLSALGAVDEVFDVADAYLLFRGPLLPPVDPATPGQTVNDQRFKKTMMLFNPVMAPARKDPRFERLCRAMGLEDYWRGAGVRPDI